jgi:hypothetical protein
MLKKKQDGRTWHQYAYDDDDARMIVPLFMVIVS